MKTALVISGGGSKGAFAIGVLKELYQTYPDLNFDIYVGTSTGSLVVSLASVNKLDTLEHLYTTVKNVQIYIKGNIIDKINDTSILDASPLKKQIEKNYTDDDYQQLLLSGKKVFLNTVCLQTTELNVFTNDADAIHSSDYKVVQTINANHFRRAMLASACQPVFMQPVKIGLGVPGAEHPEYQYVDGGLLEYVGIQMAIDAGATDIVAIMLSPKKIVETQPEFKDLMSILGQTIDIFTTDVGINDVRLTDQYNDALHYIEQVKQKMLASGMAKEDVDAYFTLSKNNAFQNKKPLNIIKIRPSKSLGGGPGGLEFDPEEMKGMMATGKIAFNDVAASGVFDHFWV